MTQIEYIYLVMSRAYDENGKKQHRYKRGDLNWLVVHISNIGLMSIMYAKHRQINEPMHQQCVWMVARFCMKTMNVATPMTGWSFNECQRHTANVMRPHALQIISECGLSDFTPLQA